MAEGTWFAQLSDAVAVNKKETTANKTTLQQHTEMLKILTDKVSSLASRFASLSQNQNQASKDQGDPRGENIGEKSGENSRMNGGKPGSYTETEGGIHTRPIKLDFPRFDGSEPINWVLKAQQFHSYNQIPENQKVSLAAFHMERRALTWYHWLMDSGYIGGYEDFVSALKTRFAPSVFGDPVGTFTKLKQSSTVEDYQTQFEILSNKISGLTEGFKVSTFLSGLKEEIRIIVTMLKPKDLTTAFGLARLQEEEVKLRSRGHKYPTWGTSSHGYTKQASNHNPPRITVTPQPENCNTNPPCDVPHRLGMRMCYMYKCTIYDTTRFKTVMSMNLSELRS